MYVITFYSFKGGVGRTLALVNVAAHLASQGKSVLMVDFDLEAPGLDSFPAFAADRDTPGVVDFVIDYIKTGAAPDASSYIADCRVSGVDNGKLALMRSGLASRNYSARLSGIDWQKLYAEQDGYLLFEDLKAQWRQQLNPDYVLIDSRTGHTDVGGICTRQLADSVVACFIPNEENICGLETVATDVRNEAADSKGRTIDLHFVLSNVPDLDDEKGILAKRLKQAKARLGFDRPAATIHRYESLSLLDNEIFVLGRRRTRLAVEYRRLAMAITSRNLEDREVALRLLSSPFDLSGFLGVSDRSLWGTMEKIQVLHANDGEVLSLASRIAKRLGREDEARLLLERSKSLGFRSPETILDSAQELLKRGGGEDALTDVLEAVNHPSADQFAVSRAVELCLQIDPVSLPSIVDSLAFRKLKAARQADLCDQMLVRRDCLPIVETILRSLIERSDEKPAHSFFRISMMLCLIGQGKFEQAAATLAQKRPDPAGLNIVNAFNYAMAEWGITRIPPADFFSRVVELAEPGETGKNILQCLSIAAWVVGNQDEALKFWSRSVAAAEADSAHTFSAWRYLQVSPAQFRDDLVEVGAMLKGAAIMPQVFLGHQR